VCSSLPFSTPNILNYNFGTLQQWRQFLMNTSSSAKKNFITSCHVNILHGTYDQGRNPSSQVFVFGGRGDSVPSKSKVGPFTSSDGFYVGLVAVHEGYRSTDVDTTTCGRPTVFASNGGIIIDGVLF
jgi:hypothetical protein